MFYTTTIVGYVSAPMVDKFNMVNSSYTVLFHHNPSDECPYCQEINSLAQLWKGNNLLLNINKTKELKIQATVNSNEAEVELVNFFRFLVINITNLSSHINNDKESTETIVLLWEAQEH